MAERRTYSEKFRTDVVRQALAARDKGVSTERFALDHDLRPGTLLSWISRAGGGDAGQRVARSGGPSGRALDVSLGEDRRGSLVRFALGSLMHDSVMPVQDLADSMGVKRSRLRASLWRGHSPQGTDLGPDPRFVDDIQRAIHSTSTVFGDLLPYPSELYEELFGVAGYQGTRIPSSWFADLVSLPPIRTTDVFARAESLYSMVGADVDGRHLQTIVPRYQSDISKTVGYLYDVAVQPPRVGTRAIHLLSRLGRLALDPSNSGSVSYISRVIYEAPLGYRAVRVLGRMLSQQRRRSHGGDVIVDTLHKDLLPAIGTLLRTLEASPPIEPYPHRSLYVECLWKAPPDIGSDFIRESLRRRALGQVINGEPRPFRERAYAAVALFGRGFIDDGDAVMGQMKDLAREDPDYDYALAVLSELREAGTDPNSLLSDFVPCAGRPETEHALHLAQGATQRTFGPHDRRLPRAAAEGAEKLIAVSLLDLHGTRRRRAIETMRHAGLSELLVEVGAEVAVDDRCPTWMRSQAVFVLGFSQDQTALTRLVGLVGAGTLSEVRVSALHAIGDIGVPNWTTEGGEVLHLLVALRQDTLDLAERRALAYALATTRDKVGRGNEVVVPALENLSGDADRLTRRIALWGLARLRSRRTFIREARVPSAMIDEDQQRS